MKNNETIIILRIIQFLILSIWVAYGLGLIAGVTKRLQSPKNIYIPVELDLNLEKESQFQYEDSPPLAVKFLNTRGLLVYEEDNPDNAPIAWTNVILTIIRVGLYFLIFFLVIKIIQVSISQEPFILSNAKRMRWIGYSFILLALVKLVNGAIGLALLEEHLNSPYVNSENCFSEEGINQLVVKFLLSEITMGFFALFVATLFKHGIELREENALTI